MKKEKEEFSMLTDRQISEKLLESNLKNESHLRFLCNVVVVYVFLTVIVSGIMYVNK